MLHGQRMFMLHGHLYAAWATIFERPGLIAHIKECEAFFKWKYLPLHWLHVIHTFVWQVSLRGLSRRPKSMKKKPIFAFWWWMLSYFIRAVAYRTTYRLCCHPTAVWICFDHQKVDTQLTNDIFPTLLSKCPGSMYGDAAISNATSPTPCTCMPNLVPFAVLDFEKTVFLSFWGKYSRH